MEKTNLKGLTLSQLEDFFTRNGEEKFRSTQVFQWINNKGVFAFDEMTNLSKTLRKKLDEIASVESLEKADVLTSANNPSYKYIFRLNDGYKIESVLMKHSDLQRDAFVTACLSTQVGCAYRCLFCASGKKGFFRNLEVWEIVDQLLLMQEDCEERISNVVIMGMGEPLANYENTLQAVRIINHDLGLNIGWRHMTISTCGLVPAIRQLTQDNVPLKLAISLHASNDQIRNQIMPINKRHNIKSLLTACQEYQNLTGRRLTFEYVLFGNFNDNPADAYQLAKLLQHFYCVVNLIPWNPVDGVNLQKPSQNRADKFKEILEANGIKAIIRKERGEDIRAACGQLVLGQA